MTVSSESLDGLLVATFSGNDISGLTIESETGVVLNISNIIESAYSTVTMRTDGIPVFYPDDRGLTAVSVDDSANSSTSAFSAAGMTSGQESYYVDGYGPNSLGKKFARVVEFADSLTMGVLTGALSCLPLCQPTATVSRSL
jgi:hypothetical protein